MEAEGVEAVVSEKRSLELPQEGGMQLMADLNLVGMFPLPVLVLEYRENVIDFIFFEGVS